MDKLYKALIYDNEIALTVIESTNMVNKAIKIHNLTPLTSAALGRTLTVSTFMSKELKSLEDRLFVTVAGDGVGGKITVCGNGKLQMRGSIDNPRADLPLKSNGKLDVGGCVGKGRITVTKSMGLKEPYSGSSEIVTGEIAEDFASYYALSMQTPTAIALGVKIGKNLKCVGAGGVIMQALPNAKEENLIKAENTIKGLSNLSSIIEKEGIDNLIKNLFGEIKTEVFYPKYQCLCSRRKTEKMILSLGKKEAMDIIKEQGKISVSCQFCNKEYLFSEEEVEKLFK